MKEPDGCTEAAADREASALMGSGEVAPLQAASSGKAGGGGKGGEGGEGGARKASRSRRIWFWSCCSCRGSLQREKRHRGEMMQSAERGAPR